MEAQGGAYATGVLVLILSAAFAVALALWRERRSGLALAAGVIFLVFAYTLADNCLERPDGLIIGSIFTLLLMLASGLSRSCASVEMRIPTGSSPMCESWRWGRSCAARRCTWCRSERSPEARRKKRAEITRHYNVRGPFLFLHVNLLDNRSEFSAPLELNLRKEGDDYVGRGLGRHRHREHDRLHQRGDRPHLDLHRPHAAGPDGQAVRYLLFGEGETGSWSTRSCCATGSGRPRRTCAR